MRGDQSRATVLVAQASGQDAFTGKSPVANLEHTGEIISRGGFGDTREASGSGWGGELEVSCVLNHPYTISSTLNSVCAISKECPKVKWTHRPKLKMQNGQPTLPSKAAASSPHPSREMLINK